MFLQDLFVAGPHGEELNSRSPHSLSFFNMDIVKTLQASYIEQDSQMTEDELAEYFLLSPFINISVTLQPQHNVL